MHEFSIADALAGQVVRYAPPGGRVTGVEIRVGALRAIEPDALRMCWEAVTHDTPLAGSVLTVDSRPWTIACSICGRGWESPVPFVACTCGNPAPSPTAGDELDLVALTVEEEVPEAVGSAEGASSASSAAADADTAEARSAPVAEAAQAGGTPAAADAGTAGTEGDR